MVITQEISDLADAMLERVYDLFKFNFRNDLELRMMLCQHMVPLKVRINYGMDVNNPLLRDVKEKLSLAYSVACSAVTVINEYFHVHLSDDEVAYFAFIFATALERKQEEIQKKNILLVCASGRGSAKLLQYKYMNSFKDYINNIKACDVGSIYKQDFSKYDYIFTTVPIMIPVSLPILEIQYFLNEKDIVNVKKILTSSEYTSSVRGYYERKLFLPHLRLQTKDEILYYMCHYVMEKKNLPEEFYQLVLKRERLAKTAFGNMAAMPHVYKAISEDTFVCVGILDNPVDWDGEMVRAVFLVTIADKDHTSEDLQRFYQMTAAFLLSQKYIHDLIKKQDYDAFIETMSKIEAQISKDV